MSFIGKWLPLLWISLLPPIQISHPTPCPHPPPTQQTSPMAPITRANQMNSHITIHKKINSVTHPHQHQRIKPKQTAGANINKVIKTKVKLANYSSNIKEKERGNHIKKERESHFINSFSFFSLQIVKLWFTTMFYVGFSPWQKVL